MFNLTTRNVYDWRDLFLLLSMEKVEPYLPALEFPLSAQIAEIHEAAKRFVLALDALEPHLFVAGEISPQTRMLFDETFQKLVDGLGETDAKRLLEWSNAILVDHRLDRSVDEHYYLFGDLERKPDLTPPSLPPEKLAWLRAEISANRSQFREIGLAIDELGQLPRDDWDNQAFDIYWLHGLYGLEEDNTSPYDFLDCLILFVKTRALLKRIEAHFTHDELVILETWCQAQPSWQKNEARPANLYFHTYPLVELLEKL